MSKDTQCLNFAMRRARQTLLHIGNIAISNVLSAKRQMFCMNLSNMTPESLTSGGSQLAWLDAVQKHLSSLLELRGETYVLL